MGRSIEAWGLFLSRLVVASIGSRTDIAGAIRLDHGIPLDTEEGFLGASDTRHSNVGSNLGGNRVKNKRRG